MLAIDLSSSVKQSRQNMALSGLVERRTGIKGLVAVFLSLAESVVLLLLLDLRPGNVPLVSSLIDLGVAYVRLSAHFEV